MNSYLYLGEYEKFLQSLPDNDFAYILFYRGLAEYYLNQLDRAAQYYLTSTGRSWTSIVLLKRTFLASRERREGHQLFHQA